TMSLFVSNLSFTDSVHLEYAKIGIMIGSFISAGAGYALLRWSR
ncbi:MAG: Na+/H+ antiporter NhaA, partial [Deltaproteobacteria bacterium]|nr:Na+/H+ antiporter NhaA [Deltaproteobacteria bacterium]